MTDDIITDNGTAKNSKGGTELMAAKISAMLEETGYDKEFHVIHSRVRPGSIKEDKKNILVLHDTWDDPENEHLKNDVERQRFVKLVFVSNHQMNTYQMAYGIRPSECVVMQNAIQPILEPASLPSADEKINLIYHTTPHRGLELLYPAYEALYNHFENKIHLDVYSSFSIYGWEQRDEPYRALFDKCKEHPGITYHGAVSNEEVREALVKAHIFAYPNIWPETSCIAAIEAMSAGCAVIAPNHGALPETTIGHGILYQYDERPNVHAQRFTDVTASVINSMRRHAPQMLNRMTAMQQHANHYYDWMSMETSWINLLTDLR